MFRYTFRYILLYKYSFEYYSLSEHLAYTCIKKLIGINNCSDVVSWCRYSLWCGLCELTNRR